MTSTFGAASRSRVGVIGASSSMRVRGSRGFTATDGTAGSSDETAFKFVGCTVIDRPLVH